MLTRSNECQQIEALRQRPLLQAFLTSAFTITGSGSATTKCAPPSAFLQRQTQNVIWFALCSSRRQNNLTCAVHTGCAGGHACSDSVVMR